jgi:hypothetical protein
MILSEPSIIILWTYQDMVEWMSRILVGEMAGADEDFWLDRCKLNFLMSDLYRKWVYNHVPCVTHFLLILHFSVVEKCLGWVDGFDPFKERQVLGNGEKYEIREWSVEQVKINTVILGYYGKRIRPI